VAIPGTSEPFGFAVWCDAFGTVVSVVWAHSQLRSAVREGIPFASLAPEGARADAEAFLSRVRRSVVVMDHALQVVLETRPDGPPSRILMHLIAATRGTRLLVIGGRTSDEAFLTAMAASRDSGEDVPTVMELIREGLREAGRGTPGEDLFDDLSRLNNELVNTQRELARKNAELEQSLRTINEMQERLLTAERDRVLMETAGAAAHEINQPLTVLSGLTEMIEHGLPEDHALRADIAVIREAADKIARIVRRMQHVRRYASVPYVAGTRIADLGASAEPGDKEQDGREDEAGSAQRDAGAG
jgi:signal transduction histidine kinase